VNRATALTALFQSGGSDAAVVELALPVVRADPDGGEPDVLAGIVGAHTLPGEIMAETVTRDLQVRWITSRIEYDTNTNDLERFFFQASDDHSYYLDLNKTNVSSEMAAIALIRDAFLHNKKVNLWWEERSGRRWIKALNLHN
jgi:hypothetical protein